MVSQELLNNYKRALQQKYNAVCFDIDGTLTIEHSTKIDSRILPILANLLKRHIPILFITGRGETGLSDLLNDIVNDLKNKYNVTDKQLLRMYALTNDGARLFMTGNESKQLFNVSEYISSKEDLIQLEELNKKIITLFKDLNFDKCCKITYSTDSKTNTIINIRIMILSDDIEYNNKVFDFINLLIGSYKNSNLNLTVTKNGFRPRALST